MTMNHWQVRRSHRVKTIDLNGRGYLSHQLGLTVGDLDIWLQSPHVQPHLQLWYKLCISGIKRYNYFLSLVNSGEFKNPERTFEEDMLFMCLGEGQTGSERFEGDDNKTRAWITTEIWARTAWRIVHSNKEDNQLFHSLIDSHPVRCYSIVIDLLCLAFHSIAHREADSCYMKLIHRAPGRTQTRKSKSAQSQTPARTPHCQTPQTPSRQAKHCKQEAQLLPTPMTDGLGFKGKERDFEKVCDKSEGSSMNAPGPITPPSS